MLNYEPQYRPPTDDRNDPGMRNMQTDFSSDQLSNAKRRRSRSFIKAVTTAVAGALLLSGCSLKLPWSNTDESEDNGSASAAPSVADPNKSFTTGAIELWEADAAELFNQTPDPGTPITVHPVMTQAFGSVLVFGGYEKTLAIDAPTQRVLWEKDNVGPLGHCAIDATNDMLYCPADWGPAGSLEEIVAINVRSGKSDQIQVNGLASEPSSGIGHIEAVPGGLVIYGYNTVFRTDFSGKVLWQRALGSDITDDRKMTVAPSSVLISDFAKGSATVLDLETGNTTYQGSRDGVHELEFPETVYDHLPDTQQFSWDTGEIFEGREECVFTAGTVVLFAPDNCDYGAGRGDVTAFDPQTGVPLWELEIDGTILQEGSISHLTTVKGLERYGGNGIYKFKSVAVYGPVGPGQAADSRPVSIEAEAQTQTSTDSAAGRMPECPAGATALSWAELSNGWVMVCGTAVAEPTIWMSQYANSDVATSGEVVYDSQGYETVLPSGTKLRLDYNSPAVQVLANMGDIKDSSGSIVNVLPIATVYFTNLGTKDVQGERVGADPGASSVPRAPDPSESVARTPEVSPTSPNPSLASTDLCPAGSTAHFEGETENFFVTICQDPLGNLSYVGLAKEGGSIVLDAQVRGTGWYAATESHGYSVGLTNLYAYDLETNAPAVDEAFIWTQQY